MGKITEILGTGGFGLATGAAAYLACETTPLGESFSQIHTALPYLVSGATGLMAAGAVAVSQGSMNQVSKPTLQIGPLTWDRNAFCRGWLITGTTGSGKTVMITRLLHELCRREQGTKDPKGKLISPPWGGIAIDEKGLYYATMKGVFETHGRTKDLMLLQTRPEGAPPDWKPAIRFNLLSDDRVPANTYANAIVKTAVTIADGSGDKGFFKTQAESNIGWGIELFRAIAACQREVGEESAKVVSPTLKALLQILTNVAEFEDLLKRVGLRKRQRVQSSGPQGNISGGGKMVEEWVDDYSRLDSPKLRECMSHFRNRYWALLTSAPEQILGVQGTIYNYLNYFSQDDVAEVFCADTTFDFSTIEAGKVVCVAMPQKFAIERRYVCTILKLLFYQHVLRRFDDAPNLKKKNLLVAWMDEAQRFIQPDDGNVDVLREAMATVIMATQSKTSLRLPLGGKDKAEPIVLNLRNRVICRAADEDCARESADFIGKTQKRKITRSVQSRGSNSTSYSMEDRYLIEPYQFRNLPDFTALVVHAEGKWRCLHFTPVGTDGVEEPWWSGSSKMPAGMRWRRRYFGMKPDTCKAPLPKAPSMRG